MNKKIQIQPTELILSALNCLEEGIEYYLSECKNLPEIGKYESDIETLNLTKLIIRHIESIIELGRLDLVLLPSSIVLARSSFETAINIAETNEEKLFSLKALLNYLSVDPDKNSAKIEELKVMRDKYE